LGRDALAFSLLGQLDHCHAFAIITSDVYLKDDAAGQITGRGQRLENSFFYFCFLF